MRHLLSILAILAFLAATPALASIPHLMPFQGVLTDSLGPLNIPADSAITFTLYAFPGPFIVWSESQTGIEFQGGRFSTQLGKVVPLSGVDFDQPLSLGIRVGNRPELSPRIQLGATPYSMIAASVAPAAVCSTSIQPNCVNKNHLLDEPGVAYQEDIYSNTLAQAPENLTSRTLTVPAPGYVVAIGTAWININKLTRVCIDGGLPSGVDVSVSRTSATHDASNLRRVQYQCWSLYPGVHSVEVTVQDVFQVNAGANTFHFVANTVTNPASAETNITSPEHNLLLIYTPSAYGTVDKMGNVVEDDAGDSLLERSDRR